MKFDVHNDEDDISNFIYIYHISNAICTAGSRSLITGETSALDIFIYILIVSYAFKTITSGELYFF